MIALVTTHLKPRNLQRELEEANEALYESEDWHGLAVRCSNDGLWDWDLKSDEIYFSTRWNSLLGYEEHEIENRPDEWFRRVHPYDVERIKTVISDHLEVGLPQYESEYRMLNKDGTIRWMLNRGLAVWDAEDNSYLH